MRLRMNTSGQLLSGANWDDDVAPCRIVSLSFLISLTGGFGFYPSKRQEHTPDRSPGHRKLTHISKKTAIEPRTFLG